MEKDLNQENTDKTSEKDQKTENLEINNKEDGKRIDISINFNAEIAKLNNKKIIGGECSAPGIIGLISVCNNKKVKEKLDLNENSNVLVIGCEGNADVKLYKQLLSKGRK